MFRATTAQEIVNHSMQQQRDKITRIKYLYFVLNNVIFGIELTELEEAIYTQELKAKLKSLAYTSIHINTVLQPLINKGAA